MLYKAFLVGAAALALIASANAAGLPGSDGDKDTNLSAGATNWNGFYIGVNGGYGWTASSSSFDIYVNASPHNTFTSPAVSLDRNGGFGGVQLGRNFQFDNLVLGIETDIQSTSITGNGTALVSVTNPVTHQTTTASLYRSATLEWFHTLRGRAGYSFGNSWIYFTAGFALGENHGEASAALQAPGKQPYAGHTGLSEALPGYVLGGGFEYALTPNWSLRSEYLYMGFESSDVRYAVAGGSAGGNEAIQREFSIVRAGLSYRFSKDFELLK